LIKKVSNFQISERERDLIFFVSNRGFVEGFENSSFTRSSGGAFDVKLAKIQKMKKGSVELNLSFSSNDNFFEISNLMIVIECHLISSLIK
jgi:hypothetical protein